MARADFTPWEPGTIVLPPKEIVKPNPYHGGTYAHYQLTAVAFILSQSCYKLDSRISQLLKHNAL